MSPTLEACSSCPGHSIIYCFTAVSQRFDVGNGSRVFSALVTISGYSTLTLEEQMHITQRSLGARVSPFAAMHFQFKYDFSLMTASFLLSVLFSALQKLSARFSVWHMNKFT